MKRKSLFNVLPVLSLALALIALLANLPGIVGAQGLGPQAAMGTAFTYQGRLTDGNTPVDGICNFTFGLYDAAGNGSPPTGGTLLGTASRTGVQVSNGHFSVELDFGADDFTGDAHWLEITVNCGRGDTTLSPRQALNPTPYALYALSTGSAPWSGLTDVPSGFADGVDDDVPAGAIIMWSGALSSIPDGWALCDGTNGTPDLRDRFIMGASDGEDPGATGGSISHSHTVNSHTHSVDPPDTRTGTGGRHTHGSKKVDDCSSNESCTYIMNDAYAGAHWHRVDISAFTSGSAAPGTSSETHLPPYFKLAFLMKLP
jgi:hypothetical protein